MLSSTVVSSRIPINHENGNTMAVSAAAAMIVKDDVEEFNSIASDSGIYERLL